MLSQTSRVMLKRSSPPIGAKGNVVKHLVIVSKPLREFLQPLRFVRITPSWINLFSWATAILLPKSML